MLRPRLSLLGSAKLSSLKKYDLVIVGESTVKVDAGGALFRKAVALLLQQDNGVLVVHDMQLPSIANTVAAVKATVKAVAQPHYGSGTTTSPSLRSVITEPLAVAVGSTRWQRRQVDSPSGLGR